MSVAPMTSRPFEPMFSLNPSSPSSAFFDASNVSEMSLPVAEPVAALMSTSVNLVSSDARLCARAASASLDTTRVPSPSVHAPVPSVQPSMLGTVAGRVRFTGAVALYPAALSSAALAVIAVHMPPTIRPATMAATVRTPKRLLELFSIETSFILLLRL